MNTLKLALVASMLTVAAVAATPTASAWKATASCYGEYNTGSNQTSKADDYCTGAWSDAGIECVGIYFPNSDPPMCIGVTTKTIEYVTDTTATASPDMPTGALGDDPLAA